MQKTLLAFSLLVITAISCSTAPARVAFSTITPASVSLASPTAVALLPLPTAQAAQATATATQIPATPTPVPASPVPTVAPTLQATPVVRSNPSGMKTWKGGTAPIETENLSIQFPNVIPAADAKLYAGILEKAYGTYFTLFGNERPYGKKISFVWDSNSSGGAVSGNPITLCGKCPNAFTIPPDAGPFHELVHDFTVTGRTRAARYVSFNGAMDETFANYFAYYFLHEVLKYSPASVNGMDVVRSSMLNMLSQYEAAGTSPYATPWKPYSAIDTTFNAMLFRVADQCGWDMWPKFFTIAYNSGNPGIPVSSIDQLSDMSQPAAKKAFSDFVGFMGQACGQDLRPMVRKWRFDLP